MTTANDEGRPAEGLPRGRFWRVEDYDSSADDEHQGGAAACRTDEGKKKEQTETQQLREKKKSWPEEVRGWMSFTPSSTTPKKKKKGGEEEGGEEPKREQMSSTTGPAAAPRWLLRSATPEIWEQDLADHVIDLDHHTSRPWQEAARVTGIPLRGREGLGHLQGKVCSVLHGVLSPAEADALAGWVERSGSWEPALLNIGAGRQRLDMDSRQHLRAIVDDVDLTRQLTERLRRFLPPIARRGATLCGLNERLRFLRYVKGNFFAPHMDGSYVRTDGSKERSFFTVLLYLTDPDKADGGATRFLSGSCPAGKNWAMCKAVACPHCLDAPITKGSVLLFSHDILHQGSPLLDGNKLVMRTDVMYSPN